MSSSIQLALETRLLSTKRFVAVVIKPRLYSVFLHCFAQTLRSSNKYPHEKRALLHKEKLFNTTRLVSLIPGAGAWPWISIWIVAILVSRKILSGIWPAVVLTNHLVVTRLQAGTCVSSRRALKRRIEDIGDFRAICSI